MAHTRLLPEQVKALPKPQRRFYYGSCSRKYRHETEASATRYLVASGDIDDGAEAYACAFCGGWHTGRKRVAPPVA